MSNSTVTMLFDPLRKVIECKKFAANAGKFRQESLASCLKPRLLGIFYLHVFKPSPPQDEHFTT